jgi:spore coat protein U-like protein
MALAGPAYGAGTHVVAVSADVLSVCTVIDAASTLNFGNLNPATGGTVNAVRSGGNFRCTTGTTFTVTSDDGLWKSSTGGANNRMRLVAALGVGCANAAECIRYTLGKVSTGTGTGLATNISFAVTGSTGISDYQNATLGVYSDTVTLTVSP